ncbi:transforming growth factor beta regulator 1 [Chrysoperla carnea]|uniref:transforming growth factor beta regulator 1 n=1 Tax=Chrysoperla carnea TaxID=189513 RepID=UPI001D0878FE|nr:transforming growth factor beta regulator 1 [Chrysoperla carnea]
MPFLQNNIHVKEEYDSNLKYKKKYFELRNVIKNLVYENAALCDLVTDIQEKVNLVKEERKFLLLKLYQFDPSLLNISNPPDVNKKIKKRTNSDTPDIKPSKRKPVLKIKKKLVQPIPLDSTGRPVFPISLGDLTIHSLGEVLTDRPEFHSEDVIYPVGFVSTRIYGSAKDPEKKCVYTCKIFDGGNGPKFEIAADSDLEAPIVGMSADYCHTQLLLLINSTIQEQVVSTRPKGNEFFGLTHSTVLNLIQSSPGTRKCVNYKWSKFEVSKHSEPITDDNDATLSYDSLQRSITFSKYHMVPEIKEEPPDEIMDTSSNTLRDLLMS